ncbi:MAG: hypothetical protein Q3Y08_11665 [Butyricicoccus sp.]|nr:hypothetical protein [Butyricicoccus sp.]
MLILDAVIFNVDRHLGNCGILFDTSTMKLHGMAPVSDHNRSLLFDLDTDQLDHAERYLPYLAPRLGTDFVTVAKGLMTDEIRNDLKNLKGFQFAEHPTIQVEDHRLDKLSSTVNEQICKLI